MSVIPVHIEPITCLQHEFSDYRVSLLQMHWRNHLNIIYGGKIKPAVMKLTRYEGDLSKKYLWNIVCSCWTCSDFCYARLQAQRVAS